MAVYTLDNLDLKAPEGARLVVLGDPISHSLSPLMHNAALREMATTWPGMAEWGYEAVHVSAKALKTALPILHQAGVAGVNLTIPHKVEVLGVLEDLDPVASRMGAVNTLVRTATGYRGTNTDGYGIIKGIEESLQRSPDGADIWIFGAGGAARGTIVACLEAGARRITVINRSTGRLEQLKADMVAGSLTGLERVRFFGLEAAPGDMEAAAIFINATALGLKADDPSPIAPRHLQKGIVVYDMTYGTENRLATLCAEAGIAYADGVSMLVWQGARSLEIWTGKPVPADCMRRAVDEELNRRKNHG